MEDRAERRGETTGAGALAAFDYPFPLVEQDAGQMAKLAEELTGLARRFDLFDTDRKLARAVLCVCYYVRYCSPPGRAFPELEAAGRFLLLFLFLNDYNDGPARADFPGLLASLLATLEGSPRPAGAARPAWTAMVEELRGALAQRAAQNGVSLTTLLYLMRQAYSAFHWEWRNKGLPVTADTFLAYRVITIFNKPWIELCRVLAGIELDLALPANPDLAEVESLAAEITYLVNDLASIQRDLEKNKPNIAFVLRDQRGLTLPAATLETRDMHDRKLRRFVELCSKLESEVPSRGLSDYLDLMKIALRGNVQVVVELTQRYDLLAAVRA